MLSKKFSIEGRKFAMTVTCYEEDGSTYLADKEFIIGLQDLTSEHITTVTISAKELGEIVSMLNAAR